MYYAAWCSEILALSLPGAIWSLWKAAWISNLKPCRKNLVEVIENAVNKEIEAGHPIVAKVLPREEAFKIPDLIRTKINLLPPQISEIRTIEIVGLGFTGRWRYACQQHQRNRKSPYFRLQK